MSKSNFIVLFGKISHENVHAFSASGFENEGYGYQKTCYPCHSIDSLINHTPLEVRSRPCQASTGVKARLNSSSIYDTHGPRCGALVDRQHNLRQLRVRPCHIDGDTTAHPCAREVPCRPCRGQRG